MLLLNYIFYCCCFLVSGNEVSLLHSNGKETLWIERGGWGKEALGDYAEVDTRGLTTFASRKDQPTPYATTTLLNRRPHQVCLLNQTCELIFYNKK